VPLPYLAHRAPAGSRTGQTEGRSGSGRTRTQQRTRGLILTQRPILKHATVREGMPPGSASLVGVNAIERLRPSSVVDRNTRHPHPLLVSPLRHTIDLVLFLSFLLLFRLSRLLSLTLPQPSVLLLNSPTESPCCPPPKNWSPRPRQLDQASRLPPTPPSGRWEGGVGGGRAPDVALIGGGAG